MGSLDRPTWRKLGLVVRPRPELAWSRRYCITPTADLPREGVLRVYYGTTDDRDIGRISSVDLDPEDPTRVVRRAEAPVLDAGEPGAFDDCGVNPSSLVDLGDEKLLYYFGYQRTERTPYLMFAGVAASQDGGRTFARRSTVPILERREDELTIRSAPCVVPDGDALRMWYVAGRGWRTLASGKRIPEYAIRQATSRDGLRWERRDGPPCVEPRREEGETGLGRPWVVADGAGWRMWYSIRREQGDGLAYTALGTAVSEDGDNWRREDPFVGIERSATGWDSEMICYATVLKVDRRWLMLYNGNGNGKGGFGVAEYVPA